MLQMCRKITPEVPLEEGSGVHHSSPSLRIRILVAMLFHLSPKFYHQCAGGIPSGLYHIKLSETEYLDYLKWCFAARFRHLDVLSILYIPGGERGSEPPAGEIFRFRYGNQLRTLAESGDAFRRRFRELRQFLLS